MTTFDLIDKYMFDHISTSSCVGLNQNACGCCSMVEEMNAIRKTYVTDSNIDDVISSCVCNRHGHQYCIAQVAVEAAAGALLESKVLLSDLQVKPLVKGNKFVNGFCDFEELYDFVHSVIGGISGIGPLTIYDTAKRIGHLLQPAIYPKQYVYLAAGAKEGAETLLGMKPLKFRESIQMFEPYFGTFPSIFIEDMLCIYKDIYVKGGVGNATVSPSQAHGKQTVCNVII